MDGEGEDEDRQGWGVSESVKWPSDDEGQQPSSVLNGRIQVYQWMKITSTGENFP